MMFLAAPADVCAAGKQDAHIAYVLKNMSLKKEVVAKFRPLLVQYYEEIARVKAPRKALREKYQRAEDLGKLTPQQCDELFLKILNSKFKSAPKPNSKFLIQNS